MTYEEPKICVICSASFFGHICKQCGREETPRKLAKAIIAPEVLVAVLEEGTTITRKNGETFLVEKGLDTGCLVEEIIAENYPIQCITLILRNDYFQEIPSGKPLPIKDPSIVRRVK